MCTCVQNGRWAAVLCVPLVELAITPVGHHLWGSADNFDTVQAEEEYRSSNYSQDQKVVSKMQLRGFATGNYCHKELSIYGNLTTLLAGLICSGRSLGFFKCLLPQPFPADATAFCPVDTDTLIFLVFHTSSLNSFCFHRLLCQDNTNTPMFLLMYDTKYIPARCLFLAVN